ncbi:hypothetical protein D8830_09135 [Streptococcus intermedius]|uniref:hypothetical protein n=1 Tax=Streptococcus intermedius TaxID=1338 RepID=UPI000DD921A6|nr:hypothetical protein [Streptococcus intermedius]RSJ16038.1 hypothetical protein D8830_09135 [Streptococcus intermedius]
MNQHYSSISSPQSRITSIDEKSKLSDFNLSIEDLAEVKQGQIAKVFGQGGGTQIQFGTGVVWYEKMGLLKEVVK